MRQTLFYLPETIIGVPLFGIGWALAIVLILGSVALWRSRRATNLQASLLHWAPTLGLAVIVILVVMPAIERMPAVAPGDELPNHGVPIRGYGVLLFLACASAVGLAVRRATARGMDPDVIYRLAVSFFIGGILGARTAFFAQYWERYQIHSFWDFLVAFMNIAEGGLVVYGSLVGAMIAFVVFAWRNQLSPFRLGDVIAPCLLLGLAIGRLGCFLNGCCWGGLSDVPWSVRFPEGSPPFVDHNHQGLLWGFRFDGEHEPWVVRDIVPDSPASRAGLHVGDRIDMVGSVSMDDRAPSRQRVEQTLMAAGNALTIRTSDGRMLRLERERPPDRSLSIHPTQIYSSLGALFLLAMVLAYDRFRPPTGAVMALTFTLYPIARFLLEFLRDDEPGVGGTPLTIAQWFSIFVLLAGIAMWGHVARTRVKSPKNLVLDEDPNHRGTPRSGTFSDSKASKLAR